MREIQEVEKSASPGFLDNIVGPAHGITAVDKHQLIDLPGEGRLDHGFPEAAEIYMSDAIRHFKIILQTVQNCVLFAKAREEL